MNKKLKNKYYIIDKHRNKNIDLVTNFMFIIELKDENLKIDVNKIFDKIYLELKGNVYITRLNNNQIYILQRKK